MTMTESKAPPRPQPAAAGAHRIGGAPAPVAPGTPPRTPWSTFAVNSLIILAGLAVWLTTYLFGFSALREHHSQAVLYSQFREQVALGTAPPFGYATTLRAGKPVALIEAPTPGLHRLVVVEGTTSGDLESGPGHLPGTVLPGEFGVSTILGRAAAYGAPFRDLTSMRPGESFTVTTGQGTFHYKVVDVRGPGVQIPSSLSTLSSRLTLVTTANGGWHDLWVPSHAVFVDAALVGKAMPDAAGSQPVSADAVMSGDSTALVPLVLWLQGLLLVSIGFVFIWRRWGRRQAWLVGGPVAAALLWGTSADLIRLLPNLF
jgi:sortase A